MKKPQIECLESPSTPLSSHNRSGAILATFLAALSALNCGTARAEVLVYEGFHQGDWPGITDTASQQINHSKAKTSGDYSTGFDKNSSWQVSDNTTQISVSGTNYGLSLPDIMTQNGFTTCGGAAQFNPSMNSSDQRGGVSCVHCRYAQGFVRDALCPRSFASDGACGSETGFRRNAGR